jgi:hypothetical protein
MSIDQKSYAEFKKKTKKLKKTYNKKVCQKWDLNPRPQRGPEHSLPLIERQAITLESGALDRSAILTYNNSAFKTTIHVIIQQKRKKKTIL